MRTAMALLLLVTSYVVNTATGTYLCEGSYTELKDGIPFSRETGGELKQCTRLASIKESI